jgi:acyl carrier protein
MSEELQEIIFGLLRSNCKTAALTHEIGMETSLAELDLNSLRIIEIVFELESHYRVQADENLLAQLRSVGDIVHMFELACAAGESGLKNV